MKMLHNSKNVWITSIYISTDDYQKKVFIGKKNFHW